VKNIVRDFVSVMIRFKKT